MKLLVVNSNTSVSVTRLVEKEAIESAAERTEIIAVTADFGVKAVESRSGATLAAHATLDSFASHSEGIDAGVIACFIDPGLAAVRELMPFPVVGIAEAACFTACMLGGRFSIVTVGARMEAPIRELVAQYGLAERLASIRILDLGVLEVAATADGGAAEFADLIEQAATEDGAEVVILGGAVTSGLARTLAMTASIPVLDGVSCAVRQAELLAGLGLPKAQMGSYSLPRSTSAVNLSESMLRVFDKTRRF